jgi:CBS domain-containing protein
MLSVRDVMHTDICRVERGATVAEVAQTLLLHNADSALVVDGEELLGVVTERDLLGIVTDRDLLKAVLPTASAPSPIWSPLPGITLQRMSVR